MNSNDKVLAQSDETTQTEGTEGINEENMTVSQEAITEKPEASAPVAEVEAAPPAALPEEAPDKEAFLAAVKPDQPGPAATLPEDASDEELFLAALNSDQPGPTTDDYMINPLERGAIIKGVVASKGDTEIMIDIGAKSEGMVSGRELEELDQETREAVKVGDELYVYVLTPEGRDGHAQLSIRRALEEQDWLDAERFMKESTVYRSKVTSFNKGGLIVRFGKVRGFVPASQVSRDRRRRATGNTPDERWGQMIGEDVTVKVIEVDRGRNRLILSERAASREMRAERRAELLESLAVGQVHKGRVISLADFGAFVDLGGADGLIHLSELSWRHVAHPKEVLKVGDEIEVEIIHIDHERQRIGLSRKNVLEDPWDVLAAEYKPNQLVQGTITKLTKFGAFARLVDHPEIEGLIHISELSDRRVEHPREVVNEGEIVTLRIIRIDPERRRMGLSLKRVESAEFADTDWRSVVVDPMDFEESAKPQRRKTGKKKDEEADEDEDDFDYDYDYEDDYDEDDDE